MPDIQDHTIIALAENASATGLAITWPGGAGTFSAEATWGGGSVTLQTQTGAGTWISVGADAVLVATGIVGFILPKGARLRASIATATAVYAYVVPLD